MPVSDQPQNLLLAGSPTNRVTADPGQSRVPMHQIGEAAERVGLSLRTVRYYEEVGLVVPSGRTQGRFRLYTDDDIERLALIKRMKPLGFTLEEMRDLLAVRDRLALSELEPAERAELLERLATHARAAAEQCDQLRAQLAMAEEFATTLQQQVERHQRSSGRAR